MWVAREKNGELYLFTKKPTRIDSYGTWIWGNQNDCIKINPDEYAVKWEDDPIEVSLVSTQINEEELDKLVEKYISYSDYNNDTEDYYRFLRCVEKDAFEAGYRKAKQK